VEIILFFKINLNAPIINDAKRGIIFIGNLHDLNRFIPQHWQSKGFNLLSLKLFVSFYDEI